MKNSLLNFRSYISPFFLVRYYLNKDIKYILDKYPFKNNLLDLGCGNKPFRKHFKVIDYKGIDFKDFSENKDQNEGVPDYHFNNNYSTNYRLPFSSNFFENSVSFQVLEHHEKPEVMIKELCRVTGKGGYILVSVPFLGGIHEEPHDYQRYTKYGLIKLFEKNKCKILEIIEQGSLFSTISMLFNEYINSIAARSKKHYLVMSIVFIPFLGFSYLSLILDKIFKSNKIFFNYLIIVQKYEN